MYASTMVPVPQHSVMAGRPAGLAAEIKQRWDSLSPELQRAARFVSANRHEVALRSMREIARRAEVTPTTLVRLAKMLGYASFRELSEPIRSAFASGSGSWLERAQKWQGAARGGGDVLRTLGVQQAAEAASVMELNGRREFQVCAKRLLASRLVACFGSRSSHAAAHQFSYAYNLIRGNGILLSDAAGTLLDQIEMFSADDTIVLVSQSPYVRRTVEVAMLARERRIPVIALTDSELSPLAPYATYSLRFRADSISYFHTLVGAMSLVETLLANVAVLGGKAVINRVARVQNRLNAESVYWSKFRPARRKHRK